MNVLTGTKEEKTWLLKRVFFGMCPAIEIEKLVN